MNHIIRRLVTPATLVLTGFVIMGYSTALYAQQQTAPLDPNKPDEQLTKEEADVRIKQFKEVVVGLEAQLKQNDEK